MIPFFFRCEIGVYTSTHTSITIIIKHYTDRRLYRWCNIICIRSAQSTAVLVRCVYTVLHCCEYRNINKKKKWRTPLLQYILNHVMCTPIYNVYTRRYIYIYMYTMFGRQNAATSSGSF